MDASPEGYPQLATFLSSDRNFMQYRGFSYLHSRLILALQYDVEKIERELDRLDRWDSEHETSGRLQCKEQDDLESSRHGVSEGCPVKKTRPALLAELQEKLMAYGM